VSAAPLLDAAGGAVTDAEPETLEEPEAPETETEFEPEALDGTALVERLGTGRDTVVELVRREDDEGEVLEGLGALVELELVVGVLPPPPPPPS